MRRKRSNKKSSSLLARMKLEWCQGFDPKLESIPPTVSSIPLDLLKKLGDGDARNILKVFTTERISDFLYSTAAYLQREEFNTLVHTIPLESLSMIVENRRTFHVILEKMVGCFDPLPETRQRFKDARAHFSHEDKVNGEVVAGTCEKTKHHHCDNCENEVRCAAAPKYACPYASCILVAMENGRDWGTFEMLLHLTNTNLQDHKETLLWDSLITGNFSVFQYLAKKLAKNSTHREFVEKASNWGDLVKFNLRWLEVNVNGVNKPREHLNENSLLFQVITKWTPKGNHNVQVVELLIANGVHLTVDRPRGRVDVLERALKYRGSSIISVQLLSLFLKRGGITSLTTAELCIRQMANMDIASDEDFELWRELADDILLAHDIKLDQVRGILPFPHRAQRHSLLHMATQVKFKAAIKYFLDKGLDINCRDEKLETPFFVATKERSVEMMTFLLDLGADPKAKNVSGLTPLHFAAIWEGYYRRECLRDQKTYVPTPLHFLLEQKAYEPDNLEKILSWLLKWDDKENHTHLKTFINFCLKQWNQQMTPKFALNLLRYAVDGRKFRNKNFWFLLTEYQIVDNLLDEENLREVVRMLVQCEKTSVLDFSSWYVWRDILKIILKSKPSALEIVDSEGRMPVHLTKIPLRILLWLLETITNPGCVDRQGRNVAHIAPEYLTKKEYHLLLEKLVSLKCGHVLTEKGGPKNTTPLHEAVFRLNLDTRTLALFQANGASFYEVDNQGESVMMYAVRGEHKLNFRFIAELNEFVIGSRSRGESTPLHLVCSQANLEAVKVLFENKKVNRKNLEGNTPLHLVLGVRDTPEKVHQIVQFLLERGASTSEINDENKLPLDVARENPTLNKATIDLLCSSQVKKE